MAAIVEPNGIWAFFQEHKKELSDNLLLVADNPDDGVEIYLTEECGMPFFQVEVMGECVCELDSVSKANAENNYQELLRAFIEPEDTGEIFTDEDLDRLDELQCGAEDFLQVLLEQSPEKAGLDEDDIEAITGLVEEYLYENFNIPIWHPMIVEDEHTGEPVIIRYPYGSAED